MHQFCTAGPFGNSDVKNEVTKLKATVAADGPGGGAGGVGVVSSVSPCSFSSVSCCTLSVTSS